MPYFRHASVGPDRRIRLHRYTRTRSFTLAQALDVRNKHFDHGWPAKRLAIHFGVSEGTINRVIYFRGYVGE